MGELITEVRSLLCKGKPVRLMASAYKVGVRVNPLPKERMFHLVKIEDLVFVGRFQGEKDERFFPEEHCRFPYTLELSEAVDMPAGCVN
jgi:hypothetical protein